MGLLQEQIAEIGVTILPKAMLEVGYREEAKSLLAFDEISFDDDSSLDDESVVSEKPRPRFRGILIAYTLLCINIVKRGVLFNLPSFISSRWIESGEGSRPASLRPTAYLDGLRGVAAWSVFNGHLAAILSKASGACWGHDGGHHELYKLPFLRLVYKGDFAVALFFIISGYALSISPVAAMRRTPRDPDVAMAKLSSATFRRPMRLLIPSWASMMLVLILIRLGYFTALQAKFPDFEQVVTGWPSLMEDWPLRNASIFGQLADLFRVCGDMLQIFMPATDASYALNYNAVLWTIKLEFRASLVLFLTHAALFYMRRRNRVAITLSLITIGISVQSYDLPLFWIGYLIAELVEPSSSESRTNVFISSISWIALGFGAYLGSFASWEPELTPLYAWLVPFTPFGYYQVGRFWSGVGATLIILSMRNLPVVVRIYTSRPIQYLGKISFAFYLVHFWIVEGFGTLIFYIVWSATGKESGTALFLGFCCAYSILLGVTIWVADLFWRCVDKPSVSFAIKIERWLFEEA